MHVAARAGIEPSGGIAQRPLFPLDTPSRYRTPSARDPGERGRAGSTPPQTRPLPGGGDGARCRGGGDRRRDRIPYQRRRSASQRSDTAGVWRIRRLAWRYATSAPTRSRSASTVTSAFTPPCRPSADRPPASPPRGPALRPGRDDRSAPAGPATAAGPRDRRVGHRAISSGHAVSVTRANRPKSLESGDDLSPAGP